MSSVQSLYLDLKRLGTAVVYLQKSNLPQKDKDTLRSSFKKTLEFIIDECSIKTYNKYMIEETKRKKK